MSGLKDFQKLLLDAGKALRKDEVKAVAFLCTDILGRSLTSAETVNALFSRLVAQDSLSAEQPHLLAELLLTIQRTRLIRDLGLPYPTSTTRSLISPYRKLLYNLSEELTDEDLKDIKFLLSGQLPRRKLEENVSTLEVFLEMEHMDLINDTDLNLLETLLQKCCPILIEKINQFKAQQATLLQSNPVAQETGRPRSLTFPYVETQGPRSLHPESMFSGEMPELRPLAESTMNYSNTSVDFPNVPAGEFEALTHGLRDLRTETSSLKVRSDAAVFTQSEVNENSFEEQTSQTTNTEDVGSYPMTNTKRGFCLIVNNYNFTHSKQGLQKREGTMIDEDCLRKVFEWLGFEVKIQMDCKREQMLSVFQELGKRDHSKMDCVVCCVLSHGQEEGVYGVDGLAVDLKDLKEPFNGMKCPSLADKPKLFFIQACQGTRLQKPVYIESDGPESTDVLNDAVVSRDSIPFDADFVLAMATVPSYVSYRERKNGTWFIQSLCQNLVKMVPQRSDLVSILTKVNADVSQRTDSTGKKKQMPQPSFTLRKKVIFPVPRAPPPSL